MQNQMTLLSGVRVFGSSVVNVAPDIAKISAIVSRVEPAPKDAFAKTKNAAAEVLEFLSKQQLDNFGNSHISLAQEFKFVQNERRLVGYKSSIGFTIVLRKLENLEELLTGLISAGANELASVHFETSKLKELRSTARRQAVAAAREKAELYCQESHIILGKVNAIEDGNPDDISGSRESHQLRGSIALADAGDKAIDPAMIAVTASVYLVFSISEYS